MQKSFLNMSWAYNFNLGACMLQELVWSLLFYSTLYEVQTLVMLLDLFWNHWDIYSTYYYFKELWIHSPRFNSTYLIQHKNTKTTKHKLDFVQSCYSEILKSVDCYCIFRWAFFDFWTYVTLPGKLSRFLGQPFQIPLSIKIIQVYLVKRSLLLSKFL